MAYTKDIGLRDFYKQYKDTCIRKGLPYRDYKIFVSIIKDFNFLVRQKVVYEAETIKLPYKCGELYIKKFENVYKESNQSNWSINFPATKEAGQVIYFGEKFGHKIHWDKTKVKLPGKKFYKLVACRKFKRSIKDAIKNKNVDYYKKY